VNRFSAISMRYSFQWEAVNFILPRASESLWFVTLLSKEISLFFQIAAYGFFIIGMKVLMGSSV